MFFLMLYKRIENGAPARFISTLGGDEKLQWPKTQEQVKKINQKQLRWLLEGLSVTQPKAIKPVELGLII